MKDVTAGIILYGGRVLITRRAPGQRQAGKWEFPGGKIEPGESAEACLSREILEELGLVVTVGEFFMESIHVYEHGTVRLLAYFARYDGGVPQLRVHDAFTWALAEELPHFDFAPADLPIVSALCSAGKKKAPAGTPAPWGIKRRNRLPSFPVRTWPLSVCAGLPAPWDRSCTASASSCCRPSSCRTLPACRPGA